MNGAATQLKTVARRLVDLPAAAMRGHDDADRANG